MVSVTLRVDNIALENPETFKLNLVSNSLTPQDGVFCINELELIILDNDGKIMYNSVIIIIVILTVQIRVHEMDIFNVHIMHATVHQLRSEMQPDYSYKVHLFDSIVCFLLCVIPKLI